MDPLEPYGLFSLPTLPTEPPYDPTLDPPRILPGLTWRLGTDEAVVLLGCTPPPAKYFGLTAYVVGTPARPAFDPAPATSRSQDPALTRAFDRVCVSV